MEVLFLWNEVKIKPDASVTYLDYDWSFYEDRASQLENEEGITCCWPYPGALSVPARWSG